jgi:hypothetical protein
VEQSVESFRGKGIAQIKLRFLLECQVHLTALIFIPKSRSPVNERPPLSMRFGN